MTDMNTVHRDKLMGDLRVVIADAEELDIHGVVRPVSGIRPVTPPWTSAAGYRPA